VNFGLVNKLVRVLWTINIPIRKWFS